MRERREHTAVAHPSRTGWRGFADEAKPYAKKLFRRPVVRYRHRGLLPADLFIASYPRSGNGWLKSLISHLVVGRPVDFETVDRLIPEVGQHGEAPPVTRDGGRLVKTHEPYRREYSRAVYLVRDIRNVAISYFHFLRGLGVETGSFAEFIVRFRDGRVDGYGTWSAHAQSWLDASSQASVLIVRYEDLEEDPDSKLAEIAAYVGIRATKSEVHRAVLENRPEKTNSRALEAGRFFSERYGWRVEPRTVRAGSGPLEWQRVLIRSHLEALAPATPVLRALGYPIH